MTEPNRQIIAITINRKKLLISGGIVVAALVVVIGLFLVNWLSHGDSGVKKQFSELQKSVEFPLYYPNELPAGYSVNAKSLQSHDEIVNFSVNHSATKFIVTEQPLPPLMEDVKKIDEFDAKAGKAYIADLEGNTAGFIKTEKTLIIIGGATRAQADLLRQFMETLVKL